MRLQTNSRHKKSHRQAGVSLIEMVAFIVVVSIALVALVGVYRQATIGNADPITRLRALEAAQSKIDEILSLKYDENTPTGGIPACNSAEVGAKLCNNNSADGNLNDVDDYNGLIDAPYPDYNRSVSVTTNGNIKLITVSVTTPTGDIFLLSAERANF